MISNDFSQSRELSILYKDNAMVAVDKPPGMLVHRTGIDRHETRFAMQTVRDLIGQRVYPVHRLDKPTSGLLLFALDRDTARTLTESFTRRHVDKRYLAIARGWLDAGLIDHPLREPRDAYGDERADPDAPAQMARTRFSALAHCELPIATGRYATSRCSLVELQPETGRRHQIRRHLKHIFHPVIGDTTYGDGKYNRLFREQFGCHRLLLAATGLRLPHPWTGESLELTCPPGVEFEHLAADLFGATALERRARDINAPAN